MLSSITSFIFRYLNAAWNDTHWLMMEMDVTQWGILSVIFVAAGFRALRTRF